MTNNLYYNETDFYEDFLTHNWSTKVKTMGSENTVPIPIEEVTFLNGNATNFDRLPWMSQDTKEFYYILRTAGQPLKARGLLFSTPMAVYPSFKMSFCKDSALVTCLSGNPKYELTNYGRIFLFIEEQVDNSSVSQDRTESNGNRYLQHNFFVIEGFYKRVTLQFQVVRTEVLPDYFNRFSVEQTEYI